MVAVTEAWHLQHLLAAQLCAAAGGLWQHLSFLTDFCLDLQLKWQEKESRREINSCFSLLADGNRGFQQIFHSLGRR